jgi:VWFA-related protein
MSALLKSFLFKYLSAAMIVTAAALSVSAQKPKPSPTPLPEDPQGSVRIPIRRVRLPITVTDKKGNFVPGLTRNDFMILEDRLPQSIETFSDDLSQTTPLFIAVLMDTSPSTAGKLKFQQESAMNFIQTVGETAQRSCALWHFRRRDQLAARLH